MKKIFRYLFIGILWLGCWELIHLTIGLDVLFPSPRETFKELLLLFGKEVFWYSVLISMLRILAGFFLGVATGTVLAVLTSNSKWLSDFLSPLLGIIKATPVASFIVLALVWMHKSTVPIFTSFLIVLPFVWANVVEGISNTDENLLRLGKAFKMNRKKRIRHIYIPSVLPYFTAALTTSMGMAWKAGIAAEVLAIPLHSIGRGIYNAKIYLNTTELFAWTVVIIILSLILEKVIVILLRPRAVTK